MNPEQFGRRKLLTCRNWDVYQSQSNEKSLVQFDYEKAVSNYLGTQSTFKGQRSPHRPYSLLQPQQLSAHVPAWLSWGLGLALTLSLSMTSRLQ